MRTNTFTCAECGEECGLSELSDYSLKCAKSKEPSIALGRLLPGKVVCTLCADVDWEVFEDDHTDDIVLGRTDVERFEQDGLYDIGKLTAYWLSN